MAAQPIARLGDAIDHGGQIIEASTNIIDRVSGKGLARVGDKVQCSLHGVVTIVDGNADLPINGKPAARVGSRCSCGATITTGSATLYSNK